MAILANADYPAIRASIHTGLDKSVVSDTAITDGGFTTDAEEEIRQRGIDYDALDSEEQARAKRAAVLLAAAYLAPAVRGLVQSLSASRQGVSYTLPAFSGEKRAAELLERANAILATVTIADSAEASGVGSMPTLFATASSRRGL